MKIDILDLPVNVASEYLRSCFFEDMSYTPRSDVMVSSEQCRHDWDVGGENYTLFEGLKYINCEKVKACWYFLDGQAYLNFTMQNGGVYFTEHAQKDYRWGFDPREFDPRLLDD